MQQQIDLSFDQERAVASLAGLFGIVALLLAAVGRPAPAPKVLGYTRITHDGQPKTQSPALGGYGRHSPLLRRTGCGRWGACPDFPFRRGDGPGPNNLSKYRGNWTADGKYLVFQSACQGRTRTSVP
jgi:hypothetical protein